MLTQTQEDWVGMAIGLCVGIIYAACGVAVGYLTPQLDYVLAGVVFVTSVRWLRPRMVAGAYVASSLSFDTHIEIAVGLTAAFFGGELSAEWAPFAFDVWHGIAATLLGAGFLISMLGFKDGPYYGWDEVFDPYVGQDPEGPY